jgi:WD40 repeat protein
LACGTDDGRVEIWDLAQGTVSAGPAGHKGPICGLEFTSADRTLISASWGAAQLWDIPRHRPLVRLGDWLFNPEAMAICSGGRQLVVVDDHETLTRWDLSTGRRLETIPGRRRVAQAVFSPSAGTLTVASRHSGQIRIRGVVAATDVVTLRHLGPQATALALAPDGRWLAVAAADGSVCAWSLGAGIDAPPWRADIRQRAEHRSVPLAI